MNNTLGNARASEEQFASKRAPRVPRVPMPVAGQWRTTTFALAVILIALLAWAIFR